MDDEVLSVAEKALSFPCLEQRVLVRIAETILNRDVRQLASITSSQLPPYEWIDQLYAEEPRECDYMDGPWHGQWLDFKTHLFEGIQQQIHLPNCLKNDIRDTILRLYKNIREFTRNIHDIMRSRYFENAGPFARSFKLLKKRFTPLGDLNLQGTFKDYVKTTLSSLTRSEKFELLREACFLVHDECVQLILCELVKWRKDLDLESSLRNAQRGVELRELGLTPRFYISGSVRCNVTFTFPDIVHPALWACFVLMSDNLKLVKFSCRQNVIKVSSDCSFPCTQMMMLWPKMSTKQKSENAEGLFKMALRREDSLLLIQTMRCLDSAKQLELIKKNLLPFILCFLKQPNSFTPDLQLVEEDLQYLQDVPALRIFLLDVLLEKDFSRRLKDCFVELCQYLSSRTNSLADHVLSKTEKLLGVIEKIPNCSDISCDYIRECYLEVGFTPSNSS